MPAEPPTRRTRKVPTVTSNGDQTPPEQPENDPEEQDQVPATTEPDEQDPEEPANQPPPNKPGRIHHAFAFLNHNDLARDLVIGLILVLAGFATAYWLENRIAHQQQQIEDQRAQHQEVLENTRFVRDVAINPDARARPFGSLKLMGAELAGLDLSCPESTRNDYPCTNLIAADLTGASLPAADLRGANLGGANLTGADMRGTNLDGANLSGANLSGASLLVADLHGADLVGADLSSADLTAASLAGADLTGANLTGANLTGVLDLTAICYEKTRWPNNFTPPEVSDPQACRVTLKAFR